MAVQSRIVRAWSPEDHLTLKQKIRARQLISAPSLDSLINEGAFERITIYQVVQMEIHNEKLRQGEQDYTVMVIEGYADTGEQIALSTSSESFMEDIFDIIGQIEEEAAELLSFTVSVKSLKSKNNSGYFYKAYIEDLQYKEDEVL